MSQGEILGDLTFISHSGPIPTFLNVRGALDTKSQTGGKIPQNATLKLHMTCISPFEAQNSHISPFVVKNSLISSPVTQYLPAFFYSVKNNKNSFTFP